MSTMLIQSGTLDDIADAIRSKTGKVASMTPLEMPQEIASISGGGGGVSILSGTSDPISSQGTDGQLYLVTRLIGEDLSDWATRKENSMTITKNTNSVDFVLGSGSAVSAQAYKQIDLTNINELSITITCGNKAYNNNFASWHPLFVITTDNPANTWPKTPVIAEVSTANTTQTFNIDVSEYTGNYYIVFACHGCSGSYSSFIIDGNFSEELVANTKLKVNDAWQDLIGSDIDDVNLGGGSPIDYTIEQGQTTSTSTATASVTSGKLYLFNTVYNGDTFLGANIIIGNTNPIYTASGIGRAGCIVRATANAITYGRYGNVSANEYTELDVTNDCDLISISDSWLSGSSISAIAGKFYFLVLGDGEAGDIVGADILVEHKLVDTVSNGTRFLIVKATGNTIALDNGNSFYYRRIAIAL